MAQARGAAALNLAFVGISNGLFDAFDAPATITEAAVRANVDPGYLKRWCDVAVMNRALHHVWHDVAAVFASIRKLPKPGGAAIIWEPAWPSSREALRTPNLRGMAFQNLSEHVQGNHFLRPAEIDAAFGRVGMEAKTHLFADGAEAVIVAR